jgi:hypothetical protein
MHVGNLVLKLDSYINIDFKQVTLYDGKNAPKKICLRS